jgi:hypothetical protein
LEEPGADHPKSDLRGKYVFRCHLSVLLIAERLSAPQIVAHAAH